MIYTTYLMTLTPTQYALFCTFAQYDRDTTSDALFESTVEFARIHNPEITITR